MLDAGNTGLETLVATVCLKERKTSEGRQKKSWVLWHILWYQKRNDVISYTQLHFLYFSNNVLLTRFSGSIFFLSLFRGASRQERNQTLRPRVRMFRLVCIKAKKKTGKFPLGDPPPCRSGKDFGSLRDPPPGRSRDKIKTGRGQKTENPLNQHNSLIYYSY